MVSGDNFQSPVDGESFSRKGSARPFGEELSNGDAFAQALRYLAEALAGSRVYFKTLIDRAKIVARNLVLIAVLGIVAAIVAATILIYATVLLCSGIAQGLGALLGGRIWAGDLITGIVVLGSIGIAARVVVGKLVRGSREQTIRNYDQN